MARRRKGAAARAWGVQRVLGAVWPILAQWAHRRLPVLARRRMDSEDLIQEAMVGVLEHAAELERPELDVVLAYAQQTIRNRIRDEIRRSGIGEVAQLPKRRESPSGEASPLDRAIRSEDEQRFLAALARLEPDERELVVGRVELDLSYEELAAALDKPSPDAARVAARRAVLKLARILGEG